MSVPRTLEAKGQLSTLSLKAERITMSWSENLPVFACPSFLQIVSPEHGWVGGFDDSGGLRCILPYVVLRQCGIRMLRFPTEPIPVGRGFADECEARMFVDGLVCFARALGVSVILPAPNTALFHYYPKHAEYAPYGTILNDLTQPEDALFRNIRKDYRHRVRMAQMAGVEIKSGAEYLEAAQCIIAGTLRKAGIKPKSLDDWREIVAALGGHLNIFVALHKGVVQAAEISAYSQHSAYGWYAGTVQDPVPGSMHLLMWETMRRSKALGAAQFNWAGARFRAEGKQAGIKDFKLRFGGTFVQGFVWKYGIDKWRYRAYKTAVRWLRSGDIVDQENVGRG